MINEVEENFRIFEFFDPKITKYELKLHCLCILYFIFFIILLLALLRPLLPNISKTEQNRKLKRGKEFTGFHDRSRDNSSRG